MTESTDASMPLNDSDIWDYVKNNPQIIGIKLSESNGLDLLSALHNIWTEMNSNPDKASKMLTILASVLISVSTGEGEKVVEELTVQYAMSAFDTAMKDILNEE